MSDLHRPVINKSILVNCPNPTDATSFYRGIGPFGALKKQMNLTIAMANELTWATLSLVDCVYLQRPYDAAHVKAAEITKSNGKPLWIDYDDDLLSVGPDNPSHRIYHGPNVAKNVAQLIGMADVVTVSTPFLRQQYEKWSKKIIVIPNAFNDFILKPRERSTKVKSNRMICWRGSATHEKDLMSVGEELIELGKDLPDSHFSFVAYNPWFITDAMPHNRTFIVDGMDCIEYHKFMRTIAPRIQIVPLHNSVFNQSKSNIAWIESCWAGAVAVAPKWVEWIRPGIVNYADPKDFYQSVKELDACSDVAISKMNQEGWEYICDNLLLSNVNKQRIDIIKDLF